MKIVLRQFLVLVLLGFALFSTCVHAVDSTDDEVIDEKFIKDFLKNGLCPQCWQSSITLDASQYPNVVAHVQYLYPIRKTNPDSGNSNDPNNLLTDVQIVSVSRPVQSGAVTFYVNDNIAFDANNNPCQNILTDADGNAQCEVAFIFPAGVQSPISVSSLNSNAIVTAHFTSSSKNSFIKPSFSSPILVKIQGLASNRGATLYEVFSTQVQDPHNIMLCVPAMIILGLFISSMQYMGKDPLSLFDITVPRLPALKRPRMKSPSIPIQLAMKGRMSARIIARTERSTLSQIRSLYARMGKDPSEAIAQAKKLFSYSKLPLISIGKAGPKSFGGDFSGALANLKRTIDASGASKGSRDRVWGVIQRNMQVREALALDLAVTGSARAGKFSGRVSSINRSLEYFGKRIAKPWKFVFGDNEITDRIPGLPFVERTALVMQNWVNSKYGNLSARRSLYKTLVAETARTFGVVKNANFVKNNVYDSKKVGQIPDIIARLRQDTYILGRAIVDEHMRALVIAIIAQKDKNTKDLVLDSKRIQATLELIKKAKEDAINDMRRQGISKEFQQYFEKEYILKSLVAYMKNNRINIYDALGNKLSESERDEFFKLSILYAQEVRKVIIADKVCTANGAYPDLKSEDAKKIDPNGVFERFTKISNMLNNSLEQLKNGRIPLVMLGHDTAELFGLAVNTQIASGRLNVKNEAERLAQIRFFMEQDFAKKLLFDYIISRRSLEFEGKKLDPLEGSVLNAQWFNQLGRKLDISVVRKLANYPLRTEWASRNYMTAYYSVSNEFSVDDERLKINSLRKIFSYQFDKGYMVLFREARERIERNIMIYQGMKATINYYTGKDWNAEGYQAWKERGATYGDIRKGVWSIDANHMIIPYASEYKFDPNGRCVGASIATKDGHLTYKYSSLMGFMGSDYAERLINASVLVKNSKDLWRPGTISDSQTGAMVQKLREYHEILKSPEFGGDPKRLQAMSIDQKSILSQLYNANSSQRADILKNMQTIQSKLDERLRLVTRESLAYDKSMPLFIRARKQAVGFLERIARGGIHDVDMRLQEWYASQSYARIALESYNYDFKQKALLSEKTSESLNAKSLLASRRNELASLIANPNASKEDLQRINDLRRNLIPQALEDAKQAEKLAIREHRQFGNIDRDVKRVADTYVPFFNVAEQTVMRDPRITYGSAYGLGPAMMSGYQTGQFVSERPQMWAGYHLLPGDRIANFLARPSYLATMAFGMHTRTFFTKLTGYTTIYHLDPERGLTNTHEAGFREGLTSLFRPMQSFDWFTRSMRPFFRGFKLRDEFGFSLTEESSWQGSRFRLSPFSFKTGGTEDPYEFDKTYQATRGIDLQSKMRTKKIGLTFREELQLEHTKNNAYNKVQSDAIIQNLKNYLKTSDNWDEKRMIRQQIREFKELFSAKKTSSIFNVPILGNFVSSFTRQGYYSVENRSGYDISAIGGVHRPGEMVWAFHDTINQAPTPGMFYTDFENRMHMFPYVTMTLANPLAGSKLATMTERVTPQRLELSGDDYLQKSGVGRPIQAEAIRDVYRRTTPIFLEFMKIEQERQMFQAHNSPYIFPIAPLYIFGYHFIKKHVPSLNNAPWSSSHPKHKDQFAYSRLSDKITGSSARLSQEDRESYDKMQSARSAAISQSVREYSCPTHGISLPVGTACPLCRSQEQADLERKLPGFWRRSGSKFAVMAKGLATSYATVSNTLTPKNYDYQYNQSMCPSHGIVHARGTVCSLCLQEKVVRGEITKENSKLFKERIKQINNEIYDTYNNLKLSSDQRSKLVDDKIEEKQLAMQEFNVFLNIDKRDVSYRHSRPYIWAKIKQSADYDNENSHRIRIS